MQMVDVTVQKVLSSMEFNVLSRLLINVLQFQTLTGMELTVFVSQDSQLLEIHAIVMASLWATIVKDVPQSQTQSSKTEFVNVTTVMLILMVFVPLKQSLAFNAMSVLTSIVNFKNAFHVQMDV